MARKLSREKEFVGLISRSAGLKVPVPERSPAQAIGAARVFGVDLGNHVSQDFDFETADSTDLIVAMEASHVRLVKRQYPALSHKLFLLPLLETDWPPKTGYLKYNIPDPYGNDIEGFKACYQRITLALDSMLQTIYWPGGAKA